MGLLKCVNLILILCVTGHLCQIDKSFCNKFVKIQGNDTFIVNVDGSNKKYEDAGKLVSLALLEIVINKVSIKQILLQ